MAPVTTAGRSYGTQYRAKTLSREARELEARRALKRIVRKIKETEDPTPAVVGFVEAALQQAVVSDETLTRTEWKQDHERVEQYIIAAAIAAAIDDDEAAALLLIAAI